MSYDSRCYDLAALFLSDSPEKNTEANRDELAQHIQTEIEDLIEHILKPAMPGLSEAQRKLDASVTPVQAAEYVRKERERNANRDKPIPASRDGFINDYD